MVECANCNHRWFQESLREELLSSSSVPRTSQKKPNEHEELKQNNKDLSSKEIKNLPSTIVR